MLGQAKTRQLTARQESGSGVVLAGRRGGGGGAVVEVPKQLGGDGRVARGCGELAEGRRWGEKGV
jgi:hypothetical protein